MNYDGILFDLDGTLWDSSYGVAEAWNIVLSRYPELGIAISVEDVRGCMGLPMDEIGKKLFPGLSPLLQKKLMDECCVTENDYLAQHGGILYKGVEETLNKLHENHKLFIVSNCQDGYIECFLKAHHLFDRFDDFESWGRSGYKKAENNRLIMERNGLKNAVYVGDTQMDADAAALAGLPFIFASYGFGNATRFDAQIEQFADLLDLS